MTVSVTRKLLEDWSGARAFREATQLFDAGAVIEVEFAPPIIRGALQIGTRIMRTSVEVFEDGSAENQCPCRASRERGLICPHVIALGLALVRRTHDPERDRKKLEEQRQAARISAIEEGVLLSRGDADDSDVVPFRLRLGLAPGWSNQLHESGSIPFRCAAEAGGHLTSFEKLPRESKYGLSSSDDAVLFVLEEICEGAVADEMDLSPADVDNILMLYRGRTLSGPDEIAITVNAVPLESRLRVDLDRETGEILVIIHTELPFLQPGEISQYIITRKSGWVIGADNFWPLVALLPEPFHEVYRQPAVIPRNSVPRFMETELPLLSGQMQVETDLSIDLFTIEPETPRFRLQLRGSRAALAATVFAEYEEVCLVAGKASPEGLFAHADPDDLMRYTVRNLKHEQLAINGLGELGLHGEVGDEVNPITGTREVMNFIARDLPALRRSGWKVEFSGKIYDVVETIEFVTPVVKISSQSGGWFDVSFAYEELKGSILSSKEIQRALRCGDHYLERDGQVLLLDSRAIEGMHRVFEDCASGDGKTKGSFRVDYVHSAFVQSSLDALDGIDVETKSEWRRAAEMWNRHDSLGTVPIPERLNGVLRPYQQEGVNWLSFLEKNGFCGILADEMGLGKTLQTLLWLNHQRNDAALRGKTSLVVCPTSLVENWAEEAARFVPDLGVLILSGSRRKELFSKIGEVDLAITSYALLRRDIEVYQAIEFSAAVLDEAQHIKNFSTQNAKAAKKINAVNRVVLTGTPMENSVSDLWSIMDFLMPGYFGSYANFRKMYELPIGRGGRDGEETQGRLRRKLHPFLLRRLKKDVAKDLPPKIQRTARFSMSPDQKKVYQEVLQQSQRKVLGMVQGKGFHSSRMEILTVLMRLRQICCHLELIELGDLVPKQPSAKMDLFFELLDEALDGGHRVLVFSQFVTMLKILCKELEARNLTYCYLDGSTKNRQEQVRTFNTRREIPLFLISLKAGGTGLNLTGADMVIHYDPWWNPAVENQATDRAYRIGQQRTVYSIKLIARDSVEEKVLELQERKKKIIDATIEGGDGIPKSMEWEDVKELLEL